MPFKCVRKCWMDPCSSNQFKPYYSIRYTESGAACIPSCLNMTSYITEPHEDSIVLRQNRPVACDSITSHRVHGFPAGLIPNYFALGISDDIPRIHGT